MFYCTRGRQCLSCPPPRPLPPLTLKRMGLLFKVFITELLGFSGTRAIVNQLEVGSNCFTDNQSHHLALFQRSLPPPSNKLCKETTRLFFSFCESFQESILLPLPLTETKNCTHCDQPHIIRCHWQKMHGFDWHGEV